MSLTNLKVMTMKTARKRSSICMSHRMSPLAQFDFVHKFDLELFFCYYFRGDDSECPSSDSDSTPIVPSLQTSRDIKLLCNDPSSMRLAFERCRLLDSAKTIERFINEGCRLLFSDVMQIYSCERPSRKLFSPRKPPNSLILVLLRCQ